jgi:hypothetical protein
MVSGWKRIATTSIWLSALLDGFRVENSYRTEHKLKQSIQIASTQNRRHGTREEKQTMDIISSSQTK